jgi:PAS domain S-box-containing protein
VAAARSFWTTFRNSRVPMVLLNREAVYVQVNDAACRAAGRAREDFVGRSLGFTTAPERHWQLDDLWTSFMRRGRLVVPWEFESGDGRTVKTDVVCVADTPESGLHLVVFAPSTPPNRPGDSLSPRELEITRLLAVGLTGAEIADRLELSPETVRTHIRNAMAALDARTRASLVARALERGLIALGSLS